MVATVGCTKFKKGTLIVVCLKDGRRVVGSYVGAAHGAVAVFVDVAGSASGTAIIPKRAIAFMRHTRADGT